MAPVKGKGGPVKKGGNKPKNPTAAAPKGKTASKVKKPVQKAVEQKTKAPKHGQVRKKKRVYTDKELNIPKLNSIVPAGIQKPNGVKKGKTFVDDQESMMAILALVQAEKEGNIESKMMKARQMEEIREARKAEQEKKELGRKQKLEETKDEIRHRKRTNTKSKASIAEAASEPEAATKPKKKRVSFG